MKKSKKVLISYLYAFIMFAIVMYFTGNLLISFLVALLLFLVYLIFISSKLENSKKLKEAINRFSRLANSLVMQITVTPNANQSLKEVCSFLPNEQLSIAYDDDLLIEEKLNSLECYYDFYLFQVFKEIIVLYETQGGNIIQMTMEILDQIDVFLKNIEEMSLDNSKKISEIGIMWIFSFGALFYIKNVLKNYYEMVIIKESFLLMISLYFIVFVLSLIVVGKNYIDIKIEDNL